MKDQNGWQVIDEDTPRDVSLLLWWRPIDGSPARQESVIGQLSSHEPGKWWNGQRGEYADIWHVTHWQLLPKGPIG
jgi:hypothetical protein